MRTSSWSAGRIGIDMPPGITPFTRRPVRHAARVLEDDLAERRAERAARRARAAATWPDTPKIVVPGLFSVPMRAEPLGAAAHDVRHVAEGLDVVHGGRHAEGAVLRGERRLLARLALLALERLEEPGLLAADVRAGAALEHDVVARSPLPSTSLPRMPRAYASSMAAWRIARRRRVLAADVDERLLGAGRERGDQDALEHLVRAALDQQPVLEGARLRLVGVADEILRLLAALRHERPLEARCRSPRRRGPGGPRSSRAR